MEQAKISSPTHAHPQQAARGTRPGGEAADAAAAPGGFLALLAALDGSFVDAGELGEAAVVGAADTAPGSLGVKSDAAPGLLDLSAIAAALQGMAPPKDGVVPQQTSLGGRLADEGTSVSRWSGALMGGNGRQQGLVAETALLDGAADAKEAALQGPVAGYGRILSRMQSALAQRAPSGGTGLADGAVGRAAQPAQVSQGGLASPSLAAHTLMGGVAESTAAVAGQSVSPLHERGAGGVVGAFTFDAIAPAIPGGQAASSALGGDASGGGRSADGRSETGSWLAGAEGPRALETDAVDAGAAFTDPAQAAAEELVADQVTYWVNQKTQNAELTLHREGQPVEVSVSLSGNEAHVSFRSDQAETREMLDRSMAQLGDLLRGEGLVLSGMSVGTSARDGTGSGNTDPQRQRDGGRQAQVVSSVSAREAAGAPRAGSARDGAVDVFV